jgi:hypothetical protein
MTALGPRATVRERVHGPSPRPVALRRAAALAGMIGLVGAAAAVLVTQGRVLVHPCVSADGPLGRMGVNLALLQSASDCPDGTLALSDAATSGAVLVFSVAVPVLLVHLVLGGFGVGLAAVLVRVATGVGTLLGAVLLRVPARPRPVVGRTRPFVVVPWRAARAPGGRGPRAHPRRGPPLVPALV